MLTIKYFRYDDCHDEFLKLLHFRYIVYVKELQYINDSEEFRLLQMEYDQYDKYSLHIVISDGNQIVGYARIIEDCGLGLPALNKISEIGFDLPDYGKSVEVSRLIVRKEKRNSRVIYMLCEMISKSIYGMDCDTLLADTFKNSESYSMLTRIGFKQSGLKYMDKSFKLNKVSTLLHYDIKKEINLSECDRSKSSKEALRLHILIRNGSK